jgi:polyisoprenoid-binding protein YceI
MIKRTLLIALLLASTQVQAPVQAQGKPEEGCPPGVPAGVFCGDAKPEFATAGTYALDDSHSAVLARVSHIGYSYSVFRFDEVAGSMKWDPADPSKSSMTITIKTASINTPVKDFAAALRGEMFLNSTRFPDATFVSIAFKPANATTGKVEGNLTLFGKTVPTTFDVVLVGAGKGFGGAPRIGATARTWIKPADFGMLPVFDRPIEIVADVEFAKAP